MKITLNEIRAIEKAEGYDDLSTLDQKFFDIQERLARTEATAAFGIGLGGVVMALLIALIIIDVV
jgi:hypothetical protein|tara:strand:- start:342 stop:536 length:195 start_codon:yes stop_codon:yes gene_type:complete